MTLLDTAAARVTGPLVGYLLVALVVMFLLLAGSVGLNLYQWRNAAVTETKAADRIDTAVDVNRGEEAVVLDLRMRLAECEAARTVDRTEMAKAIAAHNAQLLDIEAKTSAAFERLKQSLDGQCSAWASQPACGVQPE